MLRAAVLLCWLGLCAGCSAPSTGPEPADDAAALPGTSWKRVMRGVEADLDFVGQQLQGPAFGDLRKVANTARDAAEAMASGYGPHEQRDIPDFAGMARQTENWLRQIGLEAAQGHGDLARNLYRQRDTSYCVRCHTIAEQHGRRFDFGDKKGGE